MTYEELVDFLERKMSMSHVYQPLLVRALIDAGGVATVRQLAQVFLAQDESQLLYYEKRIKEMPLRVLRRHEVITSDGQLVSLNTKNLTLEQKAHIRMICEQRLQSFVQKRGIGIWDYRLLDEEPIPDSLRFLVLKAAGDGASCAVSLPRIALWTLTTLFPVLVGARLNWRICKPCAASATARNGIKMRPISGHGLTRAPIPIASSAGLIWCPRRLRKMVRCLRLRTNTQSLPAICW